MKYLLEQPIYSLYNNQEQIEFFSKKQILDDQDTSSSIETLQSVLENKFLNKSDNYFVSSFNEKQFNHICSSLSKRIQTYSLSNTHPTMTKTLTTNFSEEQTNSLDYDNTYFYSEETSKLDDLSSLTTITTELNVLQQDTSLYSDSTYFHSDTDDNSDGITFITSDLQNCTIENKNEDIIPSDYNFTGLVHAIKYKVIKDNNDDVEQSLSDYDNVNHYSEQNNTIRLSTDIVSLNSSLTSSMQYNHCPMTFTGEQLNKHEKKRTDEDDDDDDDDDYIIIDPQKSFEHLTMMNNESEFEIEEYDHDDEHFESTRLFDNGQHDGIPSDESEYSDDLRYSSDALRNSYVSDNLNNTSSTLRQEAISLTKVRCKQRQTWIRSLQTNNQIDGRNIALTCLKANVNSTARVKTAPTMLLHKNSLESNKNENIDDETPSYGFLQLNHDHHSNKTDESTVSPLLKTNSTHDKDASSTNKKTNNFYLIHHQSSLIPIKDLLNKNLNSNIEVIQMDEQECILEIVDGVLTLVPKDKSTSNSDKDKSEEQEKNSYDYQTSHNYDSPRLEQRSSSISTPSISDHEQEPDEEVSSASSSLSRSLSNKEDIQEPFILVRDVPSKSPQLPSQTDQSVDLLDLFSTPLVPLSSSNTNNNDKSPKNLLDDSLSSVSSYENNNNNNNDSISDSSERKNIRTPSPVPNQSKSSSPSTSIKDDTPPPLSPNKTTALTELVKQSPLIDETEFDYPIPKAEPPPAAKPLNKARVNEFASLLSAVVQIPQPVITKKQETPKTIPFTNRPPPSPSRSEEQSYSSIPTASSDRDERESFHTVKSNNNSEEEQTKKHIDARYNEKVDDRKSIQINTSNIKALFEQKISDTNRALSQSNEHLLHLTETKQQHKKVPISYGPLKRNLPNNQQQTVPITNRRNSFQDSANMNKYSDHVGGAKDVVIEDKQPEHGHQTQRYSASTRHNNTEEILRPGADSLITPSASIPNGYYSESLIAREIRETKEKEEELKRQRKKCGLAEDVSAFLTVPNTNPMKSDVSSSSTTTKQPVKSSSFLSNLDFFSSKSNSNETPSPRRSTQNIIYDSHLPSSNDESKQSNNVVAQELNRFNDNGIPIIRTSSTNNHIQRSASNQNILSTQNSTANIIQREIEAIRAKEAELRQLGRIQRTSDDHSDPRKYQEFVPSLPKSQSANTLSTGKARRNTDRISYPVAPTSNGFLKPKPMNNNSSISSIRGKFPNPNPTAPVVSSSNKSNEYSKLSTTDRLELERRECQEREQELKKQRHSVTGATLSVNPTMNSDSGNVSQDEHDDDQERYFDKIERLKRTENEKAHAPIIRPTKRSELSQKWEQMMANKNPNGDDDD